jgi:hypothetical protein
MDHKPGVSSHDLLELLDDAWRIICNVSGGDWSKQSVEWHTAARNFREKYHDILELENKSLKS